MSLAHKSLERALQQHNRQQGTRWGLLLSRGAPVPFSLHQWHQGAGTAMGQKPLDGDAFLHSFDCIFLKGSGIVWSFL